MPAMCKGEKAKFKGHIMLRPPTYDERFQYAESMGVNLNDDGAIEYSEKPNLGTLRRLVENSKPHYISVHLQHKDGTEYKSFDDMTVDSECGAILTEVGMKIIRGFRPSKKPKS